MIRILLFALILLAGCSDDEAKVDPIILKSDEAQAWDLFATGSLSNENRWSPEHAAKWADSMVLERRKRFGGPK